VVVCRWESKGATALLLLEVGEGWQWNSLVGVGDDEKLRGSFSYMHQG
jgi:hypothetical protein